MDDDNKNIPRDDGPHTIEEFNKMAYAYAKEIKPPKEEIETLEEVETEPVVVTEPPTEPKPKQPQRPPLPPKPKEYEIIKLEKKKLFSRKKDKKEEDPAVKKAKKKKIIISIVIVVILVGSIFLGTQLIKYYKATNDSVKTTKLDINENIGQKDLDKLINDKIILYSKNKDGINIMRFFKDADNEFLEIKRKSTIFINNSYYYEYHMIRYLVIIKDGKIVLKPSEDEEEDEEFKRPNFSISHKENQLVLSSEDKDIKDYIGKYSAIESLTGDIKIPNVFKDEIEGIYILEGEKTANIYVVLIDKKTKKYSVQGTIKQYDDYVILYGTVELKDNAGTTTDGINVSFSKNTIELAVPESSIGKENKELINGKYKKKTSEKIDELIKELDDSVSIGYEGMF